MIGLEPALTQLPGFDRLDAARRERRIRVAVRGVCRLFTAASLWLLAWGFVDATYHLPAVVRAYALVVGIALGCVAFGRWVVRPRTGTETLQAFARRVERFDPAWRDLLTGAVQFRQLAPADSHTQTLRERTIQEADRALLYADAGAFARIRPVGASLIMAGLTVVLLFTLARALPERSRSAIVRLLHPYGNAPLPSRVSLHIIGSVPERLARGEALELNVRVEPTEALIAELVVAGKSHTFAVGPTLVRIEPDRLTDNFRVRLRAGDAETPWFAVKLVAPPQLTANSPKWRIEEPAYTRLPARLLPAGSLRVELYRGGTVRLQATVDRPIRAARLVPPPMPMAWMLASALGPPLPFDEPTLAEVSANGFQLTVRPWRAGNYRLVWEDPTGLEASRLVEIRLLDDPTPTANLTLSGMANLTPDANFTLTASAEDATFGLARVQLVAQIDDEPEQPTLDFAGPGLDGGSMPRTWQTAWPLSLAGLRHLDGRPLSAGDRVRLRVQAHDADDVAWRKPPGTSETIELRIIAPEERNATGPNGERRAQAARLRDAIRRHAPTFDRLDADGSAGMSPEELTDAQRAADDAATVQPERWRREAQQLGAESAMAHLDAVPGALRKHRPGVAQREALRAAEELDALAQSLAAETPPIAKGVESKASSVPAPTALGTAIWGLLPERLRESIDMDYRDRFHPRYAEMQRRYYRTLGERLRAGSGSD